MTELKVIRAMGRVGKADSPVTWRHPDFLGTSHELSKSRTSRFTNVESTWLLEFLLQRPPLLARPAPGTSGKEGYGCRRGIVTEKLGFMYFGYLPEVEASEHSSHD